MEKERKIKTISVIALVITVACLTVAFAALSQNLTINGAATLDAAKWGIKFENLSDGSKTGDAIINDTATIADDLVTINNIDVSLKTPGDSVTYTVDLVNEGTINAEISSIETPKFTEEQERYLNFNVTYDTGEEVKQGDILNAGARKELTIKIEFDKDITDEDLPSEAGQVDLSYKLNFVQTDKTAAITPTSPSVDERAMFNWDGDTVVTGLTDYGIEQVKANNGHLVIPEGVTEIAGTSLEEATGTGYITTGFSPVAIGKLNMNDSDSGDKLFDPDINIIKSVSFPSTLKKIGDFAFMTTGITGELVIPDSVITIGDYVFQETGITSLKLGNSVEIIGDDAFRDCENLTGELIIPDSVITIGNRAFYYSRITSLKLGNNVEIIGESAFYGCNDLEGELYIPDNIASIERDAFVLTTGGINKITSISISKDTNYGADTFLGRPELTIREN